MNPREEKGGASVNNGKFPAATDATSGSPYSSKGIAYEGVKTPPMGTYSSKGMTYGEPVAGPVGNVDGALGANRAHLPGGSEFVGPLSPEFENLVR